MHDTRSLECFSRHHSGVFLLLSHNAYLKCKKCIHLGDRLCTCFIPNWELILQFISSGSVLLDESARLLWSGRYGCNKWSQRLRHCDAIHWDKKAVSQWLLTCNLCIFHLIFNLCVACTPLKSSICTWASVIIGWHLWEGNKLKGV